MSFVLKIHSINIYMCFKYKVYIYFKNNENFERRLNIWNIIWLKVRIKRLVFLQIFIGGVNKDSQYRLKETEKCIDWIIKSFKSAEVDYIIFCGDLFDSRFSINVQTLNAAINSVLNLAYNFEKVFLIVGNHDTFYKNVNTVNSIKFLEKLTQTENLIIIDEDPYFLMIQNKILGLFPWRI